MGNENQKMRSSQQDSTRRSRNDGKADKIVADGENINSEKAVEKGLESYGPRRARSRKVNREDKERPRASKNRSDGMRKLE